MGHSYLWRCSERKSLRPPRPRKLAELIEAIESGEPDKAIAYEAADVTILLHRVAGTLGLELYDAVDKKMAINRKREWTPNGNGVGQHQ